MNSRIESLIIGACLIALQTTLASTCSAQGTAETDRKNSLEKGKSALLFQINDYHLDLRAFDGNTLSYKRQYADNRSYRIGVTFDIDFQRNTRFQNEVLGQFTDRYDYSVGLSASKSHNRSTTKRLTPHFGFGPRVVYDLMIIKTRNPNGMTTSYEKLWEIHVGPEVYVGVEWFATRDISFIAEYATSILYGFGRLETLVSGASYVTKLKSIELRAQPVRFGISLYW